MPSIDYQYIKNYIDNSYPTFIETGTYLGHTVLKMLPYFESIYTIEVKKEFYDDLIDRYEPTGINFILGDSSKVFQTLLPTISTNAVFFLDGHWSSGNTGKGEKDCPLIEEITHINNLFKHNAMIIIDDCRLFGKGPSNGCNENWSDINENSIINCIKDRIKKVIYAPSELHPKDRMIIYI